MNQQLCFTYSTITCIFIDLIFVRKQQEIGQYELTLQAERSRLYQLEKQLREEASSKFDNPNMKFKRILEQSNIIVCAHMDIETAVVGQAFGM